MIVDLTKMEKRFAKGGKMWQGHALMEIIRQRNVKVMAEVGVWKGTTVKRVLRKCDRLLDEYWAIDCWKQMGRGHGRATRMTQDVWEDVYQNVCWLMHWFDSLRIVRQESCMAAMMFPDGYFDFVFIDASHYYYDVLADICAWLPKVKKGGVIGGHDYVPGKRRFQVAWAVNDVFEEKDIWTYPRQTLWGVEI